MQYSWMYRLKCLLLDKTLLFWSLFFPLMLATFFNIALRPALTNSEFEAISVAVVSNETTPLDEAFQTVLKEVSSGENQILKITYCPSKDAGVKLLNDDKVIGVITDSDHVYFRGSGMSETILQSFMNQYKQKELMVQDLLSTGASIDKVMEAISSEVSFVSKSENETAQLFAVNFYTIIGMVALFGGYWGLRSVRDLRADQSPQGARVSIAPTNHLKALFADIVMDVLIQFSIIGILLLYMNFVLDINFGNATPLVLLISLVGSAAGTSMGMLVSCYGTKNYQKNSAIVTSFTLFCSFLSGMMSINVKYIVEVSVPIVAAINPVNMITDGLYAIYYYGAGERYWTNLGGLCIFTLICFVLAFIKLRRKKYASL